jgi:hypothetical protein
VESESISGWIDHSLLKWRRFVGQLSPQNSIAIKDGAVLQCGLGELLERGADDRTVLDYGRLVADILKPVRPILIYMFQRDIETALRTARTERPEMWGKRVEAHFANTVYGRNRSLTGFDLYTEFNWSLIGVSYRFIDEVKMGKLLIDCTDRDWSTYMDRIRSHLNLSQIVDPFRPYDYSGDYISSGDNRVIS